MTRLKTAFAAALVGLVSAAFLAVGPAQAQDAADIDTSDIIEMRLGNPDAEVASIEVLHLFIASLREEFHAAADQLGWEFFTHTAFTSS